VSLKSNEVCGRSHHYCWRPPWVSVSSASVVSLSMSVVLRGAKIFRDNNDFAGSLTAEDVGNGLVEFLDVCEVLSYMPLASIYFLGVVILGR
jgi:hypothetical protein